MKPSPGSLKAQELGCQCPIIDNHYGNGMPHPDGPRFWIAEDCKLHHKQVKKVAKKNDKKTKKDSKRVAGY